MINRARNILSGFFNRGQERTVLIKKNIAASFGLKGVSMVITLVSVPLTINYLNPERNGIWLTLFTLMSFLCLFDIGIGTGMKNKLAEAKAQNKQKLARQYISSTYAVITIICVAVFALFCIINPYLDWVKILKLEGLGYSAEIPALIWITMAMFCGNFVLNPIKTIVTADQRPAIAALIDFIWYVITFAGTVVLYFTTQPSLIYISLLNCISLITVYAAASIFLFSTRYKKWRPSLAYVDFRLAWDAMKLGLKFLVATAASIMVMQTLPYLIQWFDGPAEVTNYNSAMRLFQIAVSIIAIIALPYWSSFTDAYTKGDTEWMQRSVKNLYKFFCYLLVAQAVLLLLSPVAYYIWVNYWLTEPLDISFAMSVAVCLFSTVFCWTNLCIYPINGMGKTRVQLYSSVVELILLIPVAVLLGKFWGAVGIVLAATLVYTPRAIWAPVQLNRLVTGRAKGVWNK